MPQQEISENVNRHLSAIRLINDLSSTMNNQQDLIDISPDESMNAFPVGIASNDLLSTLESTFIGEPKKKKRNRTVQEESSIKENDDRFNRSNFLLKNIGTSMTYMDVFISLATTYPLVQLNVTENLPKIQYLCVAGNALVNMNNISRL